MEIKCTSCGKEIVPLELYDGNWSCPLCRNKIREQKAKLKRTKENEELFLQGELLYAQWLFNRDGSADLSVVEKAINLCRISARQGNPKAIARLGYYYDKDYVGTNFTEAMRVRIAHSYYSQVCYSILPAVDKEEGLPEMDWDDVRKKTAQAMLFMLSQAPSEVQENPTYSLDENLMQVHSLFGEDFQFTAQKARQYKLDAKERFYSAILACNDEKRAPLFGVFKLSVGDIRTSVQSSTAEKAKEKGKSAKKSAKSIIELAQKGVSMRYIKVSDFEAETGRKILIPLKNQGSFTNLITENNENDMIWLFFFNDAGGHKYLSKGKRAKVKNSLCSDKKGIQTNLIRLLNRQDSLFSVFYDDDVYQFCKQRSPADATKELIRQVVE
jgi:predicted RNA-binding Zn-ribbon protein involved in translation (DUF1610 family)